MATSVESWLKSEVGIKLNIHNIEDEFSNGYYLGQIFHLFGLCPDFYDKFANKHQAIHVKRNYECLRELFLSYNITFSADLQDQIRKRELGAVKRLLFNMKTSLEPYESNLNSQNKTGKSEAQMNIHHRTIRQGMNPKNKKIEMELVPFEEELLKQRQKAIEQKSLDDQRYKTLIQSTRSQRLDNLQTNHLYMKEWEKQHTQAWRRTKLQTMQIKENDNQLNQFLTQRIVDKEISMKTRAEKDCMEGIQQFEASANRLGFQLHHNPDTYQYKAPEPFNPLVVMRKVQGKVEQAEIARKEIIKRQHRVEVDQRRKYQEAEEKLKVNQQLDRYLELTKKSCQDSSRLFYQYQRHKLIDLNRQKFIEDQKLKIDETGPGVLEKFKFLTDEEYETQKKTNSMALREHLLAEKEKHFEQDYEVCFDITDYLLEMTEKCYEQMQEQNESQIDSIFWRGLQNKFVNFDDLTTEQGPSLLDGQDQRATHQTASALVQQSKVSIQQSGIQRKQSSSTKIRSSDYQNKIIKAFSKYLEGKGNYQEPLKYKIFFDSDQLPEEYSDDFGQLGQIVDNVIENSYPILPKQMIPYNGFTLVPLRINILGHPFSGKKTLARQLGEVLGLDVFIMDDLVKECIDIVKQEEDENQNQGGQKQAQSRALKLKQQQRAKKQLQNQNEGSENQISEESIRIKEFGLKLLEFQQEEEDIPEELLQELLVFKVNQKFKYDNPKEYAKQYITSKEASEKSKKEADEQQANSSNQPIMDSKKKGAPKGKQPQIAQQAEVQETFKIDKFQYHFRQGFIVVGFPQSTEAALQLDNHVTGFVPQSDRLNRTAEEKREVASKIVQMPERAPENNARPSFDVVISMDIDQDKCLERLENRVIDPQTQIIYHPLSNPLPENDKKLKERVQEVEFNMENIERNREYQESIFDQLAQWYGQFGYQHDFTQYFKAQKQEQNDLVQLSDQQSLTQRESNSQQLSKQNSKQSIQANPLQLHQNKEKNSVATANNESTKSQTQTMTQKQPGSSRSKQEPLANIPEQSVTTSHQQEQQELDQQNYIIQPWTPFNANHDLIAEGKEAYQEQIQFIIDQKIKPILELKYQEYEKYALLEDDASEHLDQSEKFTGSEALKAKKSKLGVQDSDKNMQSQLNMNHSKVNLNMASHTDMKKSAMSDMYISRRLDNKSMNQSQAQPKLNKEEKMIRRCMLDWENLASVFIDGLDKELKNINERITQVKSLIKQMQTKFLLNFDRRPETSEQLHRFVENYSRFIQEQKSMVHKNYTKEQIKLRVNDLHDQIWEIIKDQKDRALQEKAEISQSNWLEKEIQKIMGVFLNFVGSELNKFHYLKKFLADYYQYQHCHSQQAQSANTTQPPSQKHIQKPEDSHQQENQHASQPNGLSKNSSHFQLASQKNIKNQPSQNPSMQGFENQSQVLYNASQGGRKSMISDAALFGDVNYNYEMEVIKIKQENLPKISHKTLIPYERFDYIQFKVDEFYERNILTLDALSHILPQEMVFFLKLEIQNSLKRIEGLRNYIQQKLKKLKIQETLFKHRLEDWIVYFIKNENKIVHDFLESIKQHVESQNDSELKYRLASSNVTEIYNQLDFTRGPIRVPLNPIEEETDRKVLSQTQLTMLLQDILNSVGPKRIMGYPLLKDIEYDMESLTNLLYFRMRNNELGSIKYFPPNWKQSSKGNFKRIFLKLDVDGTNKIGFQFLATVLTLLRYPVPSVSQLNMTMEQIEDGMSQEEFLKTSTWIDEFDEQLCTEVKPEIIYKTGYVKKMLFWIHQKGISETDGIDKETFKATLSKVTSPGAMIMYHEFLFQNMYF